MYLMTTTATVENWLMLLILTCTASVVLCAAVALITRKSGLWLIVKIECMVVLFAGIVLAILDRIGLK